MNRGLSIALAKKKKCMHHDPSSRDITFTCKSPAKQTNDLWGSTCRLIFLQIQIPRRGFKGDLCAMDCN